MSEKKRLDIESKVAVEMVGIDLNLVENERLERELRDNLIADANQKLGRIEALRFMSKIGTVSAWIWFDQVKKTEAYKYIPECGSWERFCNRFGFSARHVDRNIENLATFGEGLYRHMLGFKVGYRDLRKLRFAVSDGEMTIENDVLKIGNETIPIDIDHKEDLKAAIETLLEEKDDLNAEIHKTKKKHEAILHEETRGLKAERDMLIQENKRLKVFAPEDKDPETWSFEQMKEIRKAAFEFTNLCRKFVIDERLDGDMHLQAQVLAEITEVSQMFRELQRLWDKSFSLYDEV